VSDQQPQPRRGAIKLLMTEKAERGATNAPQPHAVMAAPLVQAGSNYEGRCYTTTCPCRSGKLDSWLTY
jgi:hypothetical protein